MRKLILAILVLSVFLSGCSNKVPTEAAFISDSKTTEIKVEETESSTTPAPITPTLVILTPRAVATVEQLGQDAVEVIVPKWIILELTEPMVAEFIYFESEYRYISEDTTSNTYYLDKNDYDSLVDFLNPPDFALVKTVCPEYYTLVDSIEIDENGDTVNVVVSDISFFTSTERNHVMHLTYQCALYKCIMGVDQNDISIELNYTVLDSKKEITTNIPFRLNSVVNTTDDMQHEFEIHVPTQYTRGDPEAVKQQLIMAGVEDITINEDGTLDYIATKELIIQMGNDYHCMMENIFQNVLYEASFITKIYYDALNTTIIIEVDFENCDFDYLEALHRFLNDNTQFEQLFSGVKAEDIEFKIVSVDNQYMDKIIELIYPPYGE